MTHGTAETSLLEALIEATVVPPGTTLTALPGGYSNITYLARAGDEAWVVRRPPFGPLPSGAHDVAREASILQALRNGPVPVPDVVHVHHADSRFDAPFYVTRFVDADVLRDRNVLEGLGAEERHALSLDVVRVLADIHAVDPASLPLHRSQRPYVARQLGRWHAQFDASRSLDIPLIDEVYRHLVDWAIEEDEPALLHGDYHLDNVMVRGACVATVLDWELAAIGDRFADLGLMIAYWSEPDDAGHFPQTISAEKGFASRAEILDAYATAADVDLPDMRPYLAFAHWKIACIAEGIHARIVAGAMGDRSDDIELIRQHPHARAEAAAAALDGWP